MKKFLVLAAAVAAVTLAPSVSASSPPLGNLEATKECSGFTGDTGSFCTITSSNLALIEVGSRIVYLQPGALFTPAGSDVVLHTPRPGNSAAFGNCSLAVGHCTFWGGTGRFTWFHASIAVSYLGGLNWAWAGTYNFGPWGQSK